MSADPNPGVRLVDLFKDGRFYYADDIHVSSCCASHKHCRPGDLYVALSEADFDGHDYAHDAVERGAKAILTERLLPLQVAQCVVPNSKEALGRVCQALAGSPSTLLPVHGIAGHYGKTATQVLIASMLDSAGHRPAIFGSRSYTDGFEAFPRSSPKATASRYAQWLASVQANGCSHAVTSLPRSNVMQGTYAGADLGLLVLTGFETATHRNKLSPKTEAYLRRVLAELKPEALVVANVDCPIVRGVVQSITNPLLTVSLNGEAPADISATLIEQFPSEQTYLIDAGSDSAVIRTRVVGERHMRCCLLATAAGLGLDIPLSTIISGIESIDVLPGILERVECGQPFSIFADACSSEADLKYAIHTLRKLTTGRLICVYGQGYVDQANAASAQVIASRRGRVVERFADVGVITSDDAHDHQPLRAVHNVLDGYSRPAKAQIIPNRIRAIEWAVTNAKPGDTVLLAGPHNRCVRRHNEDFHSDADVSRYWLHEHGNEIDLDPMITP